MTRKHVRATVELTVEFELEGRTRCQATCRDLGLGGAFLVTAETADLGTMLSLFLQLPGKGDPVAAIAFP